MSNGKNNKPKLQPHQEAAVSQFKQNRSLIAYHGLGSGKTLTSLEAGARTPGTKLVVLPASLKGNYAKEIEKHNYPAQDYKLMSYEKFRKNPEGAIAAHNPSTIIMDEFHRTKDPGTQTGTALRSVRSKVPNFIGLTGSIAQNKPSEIGELLHSATGKPILGKNKDEFNAQFVGQKVVKPGLIGRLRGIKPGTVQVAKNLPKFRKAVEPYVHTFAGDEEYMKHIPKTRQEIRRVEMDKGQQKIYDYTFNSLPRWTRYKIKKNLPPNKLEAKNMNAFLQGARQVSNTAEAFGSKTTSPKISAVVNDIQHGINSDPNFRGVVYSNFVESGITPLSQRLTKANIPHGTFTGSQTPKERNKMVKDYNEGRLKTLLLSPAGAEGLDLKGTKMMGVMEPSWNPERTKQAIGRTARFMSHDHLPESERNVRVVNYQSTPRLRLGGRIRRIFNPNHRALGVDEYIANRADEKSRLTSQFTDTLKRSSKLRG